MTRYAKFELRVKLADNEEFQPCNLLKFDAVCEDDSDTNADLEANLDIGWSALGDSYVEIDTESMAQDRALVIVDNTQSDNITELVIWDGTYLSEHYIKPGRFEIFDAEIDHSYNPRIKCQTAGETCNVRVIIFGESA